MLGRLLLAYPNEKIGVLIRPTCENSSRERSDLVLQGLFPPDHVPHFANRVIPIEGDLLQNYFGLGAQAFSELAVQTSQIFHCAASVSFSQPLEEARSANVTSTERILDYTYSAQLRQSQTVPLHYVSTAYVVGDTEDTVDPDDLTLDTKFKNTYEQSKAEAEALVRHATNSLQCVIYRPSIIVGDSVTGETSSFNVIYGPARFLARGLLKVVPGVPSALFDMVPVDYVADAIIALSKIDHPSGSCYHLCSGVGAEATLVELLEYLFLSLNKTVSRTFAPPPFLTPELIAIVQQSITVALGGMRSLEKFLGSRLEVLQKIVPYFLYMIRNPRFNIDETTRVLNGIMPPPPMFHDYAEKLFDYCNHTNWGKLPWTNPSNVENWFERVDFNRSILTHS